MHCTDISGRLGVLSELKQRKLQFLIKPQKCFWKALSSKYKPFLGAVSLCQWGNSAMVFATLALAIGVMLPEI